MKHLNFIAGWIISLSLIGCLPTDNKSQNQLGNIPIPTGPVSPSISSDPVLSNVNAPVSVSYVTSRLNPTQPSFLPNGAYTGLNGFQGDCVGITTFGDIGGDFEVYADDSATFWASIPEKIQIDMEANGVLADNYVTLLEATTNHQGLEFSYQYLGQKKWQINYAPGCYKIYICHIGDCLN